MQEKYWKLRKNVSEIQNSDIDTAFLWTGTIRSQVLADLLCNKLDGEVVWFELVEDGVEPFRSSFANENKIETEKIVPASGEDGELKDIAVREILNRGYSQVLMGDSCSLAVNPLEEWDNTHVWAYLKREFVERFPLYTDPRVNFGEWDYWEFAEKFRQTVQILEEKEGEDSMLLWTGGKEAQVLADIVLKRDLEMKFGVIDTGNQFEEIYSFRDKFTEDKKIDLKKGIYEDFLEKVINNPEDPRGYHGRYSGSWKCSNCGNDADLNRENYSKVCDICGTEEELHEVQRQNLTPEDWGVPESCGVLKVEPLKEFIESGFKTMITGRRGDDPVVNTDTEGELEKIEEIEEPAEHERINPLAEWNKTEVWTYLLINDVPYCSIYDEGYEHTDAKCCTSNEDGVGEYGEGGRDPEKESAKERLQDMGYI